MDDNDFEFNQEVFQERLRLAMWRRKMKQSELAGKTGISYKTISTYINGHSKPSLGALAGMAKALNVSVDWLLGLSDVMEPEDIETEDGPLTAEINIIRRAYKAITPKERRILLSLAQALWNDLEKEQAKEDEEKDR
ncbi:MAG: helix-turn-helix domain-containing protein [Bacillota bacterium]